MKFNEKANNGQIKIKQGMVWFFALFTIVPVRCGRSPGLPVLLQHHTVIFRVILTPKVELKL